METVLCVIVYCAYIVIVQVVEALTLQDSKTVVYGLTQAFKVNEMYQALMKACKLAMKRIKQYVTGSGEKQPTSFTK